MKKDRKTIEDKIKKFEKLLKKEKNPENIKNFKEGIAKFESMLEDMVEDKPKPKEPKEPKKPRRKPNSRQRNKPSKPPKRKPATRKPATGKTNTGKGGKKGIKVLSSKRVMIDGEEVAINSQEMCDYLLAEFKKRRAKAKDSKGKKKKTKSVMAKVSDNIEKGITQAIKQGVKNKKSEIKKDPKAFFGKVKKLETATRGFLNELKNVLGKDFNSKEVTSTIKGIQDLVAELKKKV